MTRAFDDLQARRGGDQFDRVPKFLHRAEGIARSVNKDRGNMQLRKVLGAKLCGLPGWVQRIRKKEEPIACTRILRRDHTGLPASIGLSSKIQRDARSLLLQ